MFIPHSSPFVSAKLIQEVSKVLKSGHLEDGAYVAAFEQEMKERMSKSFAVATSSGFSAIHLALIGMGIKKGDEVILPSYSCTAVLNPVLIQQAKPVLVDTGKNSFNTSVDEVKKKITSKTKAIIIPHIFGFSAEVDQLTALGIPVIEDCAQSMGGEYKGKLHGSLTDNSVFSFYATKMMTTGDGGMLLTNDRKIYETALNYRYYGHKKGHAFSAYNYKMNNIEAAMGLVQLKELPAYVAKRKKIATIYDNYFAGEKLIHTGFENRASSVFYRYPLEINNRDSVMSDLKKKGIGCGYGVLEGLHELRGMSEKYFPNTAQHLKNIISIPIYPKLSPADAKRVATEVIRSVKRYASR